MGLIVLTDIELYDSNNQRWFVEWNRPRAEELRWEAKFSMARKKEKKVASVHVP